MMRKRALAGAIMAVLAMAGAALAGEADVAWIGQLPGLTVQTSGTTSYNGFKAVYTMTSGADAAMESVRKGLLERGWTIKKDAEVPAGGAAVQSLSAQKGTARLKVSVTNVMGVGTLSVSLRGDAGGGSAPAATAGDAAPAAGGSEAGGSSSGGVVITGRAVRVTRSCGGGDATVTGSSSEITLQGSCGTVKVVGNANTVVIEAAVKEIHAVGRANTIVWSAGKNPAAPVVKHLGSQNRVRSDAE
jgi:hypothetical protein